MTSPTVTSAWGEGAPFDGSADAGADGDEDADADGVADGVADCDAEGVADGLPDGLPDGAGFDGTPGVLGEGRTAGAVMTARPLLRSKDATLSADFSASRPLWPPPGRATALGVPPLLPSSAPRTVSFGDAVESAATAASLPLSGAPDSVAEHPATSRDDAAVMASKGAILRDLRKVGPGEVRWGYAGATESRCPGGCHYRQVMMRKIVSWTSRTKSRFIRRKRMIWITSAPY
ncbi:hypothetical protein ACWC2K_29675 [Streptomyces chattanoogensis]